MTDNTPISGSSVLARVCWMMIGPMVLALLAFHIVSAGSGWFTPADFAFLAVLGGTVLARWVEHRGGHAQTATGEPATADHLRRYVLGAMLLGLGAWSLANLLGNHWLAQ